MNKLVKLDYSNCLKEFTGEYGISIDDIDTLQPKISEAYESINSLKKKGKLGFMELPYKAEVARKIKTAAKKLSAEYDNFVVIGIGGSALGNIALQQALRHPCWNMLDKKGRKGYLKKCHRYEQRRRPGSR